MRYPILVAGLAAFLATAAHHELLADEGTAQWIWFDEGDPLNDAPAATRYFRKTFDSSRAGHVTVDITCDDAYTLYVNGDTIGSGNDVGRVREFEVTSRIRRGTNVLAVQANNTEGPAGLLVRLLITQTGGTQVAILSDNTWKSSADEVQDWTGLTFDDSQWLPVRALGEYGKVGPWRDLVWDSGYRSRFVVPEGFRVERACAAEISGSVISMTFDEQGRILASQEQGPVLLLVDDDGDGVADRAQPFSDEVTNCQGLLVLDGRLYAVGNGPEGTGLYRLTDADGDDRADQVELLGKFDAGMGEHGPHAIVLGPDGYLYLVIGNHAHMAAEAEPDSPHLRYYEGDLLPRYEDAHGHARGIKSPGGTVVRLDRDGKHWWRVAGGFRNAYDIAFNDAGELFTFDSDMEWDVGLPWYRPVRVCHVIPGAEFGWRSGAAKWPPYYLDSLPSAVDIGRGSPTGVVFYHHRQFPEKYYDAFFIADWSQGRILAIHLDRKGGTWKGAEEVFATGNPLNVSDLEVGPDGGLYFSCGGRGTEGGVFRIDYTKSKPTAQPSAAGASSELATLDFLLTRPQPEAAWSRAEIRRHLDKLDDASRRDLLESVAADSRHSVAERTRALRLLQQFGPQPTEKLLTTLTHDPEPVVRAYAVSLLGLQPSEKSRFEMLRLLWDGDGLVRRRACEALVRSSQPGMTADLLPLLADRDRWVRFAGRRALERLPLDDWKVPILEAHDVQIAIAGCLSLLVVGVDDLAVSAIRDKATSLLEETQSNDDLLDVLRVIELALLRQAGGRELAATSPENAALAEQLLGRFPSDDRRINRELARLLAYLHEPKAVPAIMARLAQEPSRQEQIHLAYCARFFTDGWTSDTKRQLLAWYDDAHGDEGGYSYSGYLENFARDFLPVLTSEEQRDLLRDGASLPVVTRLLVDGMDSAGAAQRSADLIALDRQLEARNPVDRPLAESVVAALGRAGTDAARNRLHEVFETIPDRRDAVARALAQHPTADDWPLFVRSLDFATGETLIATLKALNQLDRIPDDPEVYRATIIAAQKAGEEGSQPASELLARWTHEKPDSNWQEWFAATYPNLPPASLPKADAPSKWTYDQLLAFLSESDGSSATPERGRSAFEKAQCIKCHRFGSRGEGIGPDLTTVRRRFQRKEILESILYPSQVISDQYKSATVVTVDGVVRTGMAAPQPDGSIILLLSDTTKVEIPKDQIDEVRDSPKSSMPEGLLDTLTLQDIADLFEYLEHPPIEAQGN